MRCVVMLHAYSVACSLPTEQLVAMIQATPGLEASLKSFLESSDGEKAKAALDDDFLRQIGL